MKKKKILALSHTFVKEINLSFYKRLSKSKFFNIICVGPKFVFINNNKLHPDFKTKNLNSKLNFKQLLLKGKKSRFFYFKKLSKLIKSEKPDFILIDNDPISIQSLIIIFYSYFFNFKICYFSLENSLLNESKNISLKKIIKIILLTLGNLLIKRWVYKIFCFTNQIKKNCDFLGYKNKTFVMPLGYNEDVFKLRKKKKKNFFTISYFGRISREKGILTLLKSLNYLSFDNWVFMIDLDHIEDLKYYNELEIYLLELKKQNKLKIISCDYFEISKIMSKTDIVVLPSEYPEQYGRVIQESIASGSLVIGSNVGGIPEIINDKKLLFKPGNYKEIAKLINQLFHDKNFYNQKFKREYKDIKENRTISKQVEIFIKNIIT